MKKLFLICLIGITASDAYAQKIYTQQDVRNSELKNGGFKWISWQTAGPKIWNFVRERDPGYDIRSASNEEVEVAIVDLDLDKKPDVILYDLDDGQANGYLFKIYFSDKNRKAKSYIGHVIRPYMRGVRVDGGYYSLY